MLDSMVKSSRGVVRMSDMYLVWGYIFFLFGGGGMKVLGG